MIKTATQFYCTLCAYARRLKDGKSPPKICPACNGNDNKSKPYKAIPDKESGK